MQSVQSHWGDLVLCGIYLYLALFLGLGLLGEFCLEKLLRIEHQYYPDEWEKDGKPSFFAFTGKEASFRSHRKFRFRMYWRRLPQWVQENEDALWFVKMFRRTNTAMAVMSLIAFAIVLITSFIQ